MIGIGIYGATGYTGLELLRLLARHPEARVTWLTSESSAGQKVGDVFSAPPSIGTQTLIAAVDADPGAVDLVFCCLPHAASQDVVATACSAGARVVDLSADYRLRDPDAYQQWYGHPHVQRALLAEAVYGLPELNRHGIKNAGIVANPGCYPTSVILGLAPLARRGWLSGTVIADSKSGVSGAGRQPSLKTHFVEANENLSPYSVGRVHRHLPEMEQELNALSPQSAFHLIFSPHLAPISRGMLSTIYVTMPDGVSESDIRTVYAEMYGAEQFIHLVARGRLATMAHTINTNYCAISLTLVPETQTLIVASSIDNLGKGASGQAVQNMNVMYGLPERTALI